MEFIKVATAAEASRHLVQTAGRAYVLAGGTDLLVQMKSDILAPDVVVDIKAIPGIGEITEEADGIRVGATVPGIAMSEHAELAGAWPGVVEATQLIGSTQVQGRCTMVGNLCNASPAADSVPALVAADAVVRIEGPEGNRECPVIDIPTGPGRNSLAKGELITSVLLPARPERAGDAYLRFIPRTEMDIAVVSAGVNLVLDEDGIVTAARVALGAVAPTVVLVPEAAASLLGTKLDDTAMDALATACEVACNPIDDKRGTIEFRIHVAGVMARRAAKIAYQRAGGAA